MLDTTGVGLLKSVEQLLSEIFIPTLRKMNHGWGELASPQAQDIKRDFMASLENFVSVLAGAQDNLQEKVRQRHMQISTRMCIQMHLTVHKNICI